MSVFFFFFFLFTVKPKVDSCMQTLSKMSEDIWDKCLNDVTAGSHSKRLCVFDIDSWS